MKGLVRTAVTLSAISVALANASLFINILTLRKSKKIKKIAD